MLQLKRYFFNYFSAIIFIVMLGTLVAFFILYFFGRGLPTYQHLSNYEPPVVSRMYASDGRLFGEYAHEKRVFIPINTVPDLVKHAFLAAEDKNFYSHMGIDPQSILRSIFQNIGRLANGRRPIGASTITQQVARNFLLADIAQNVSMGRKVKEAILAVRLERTYSKDKILELYLNEIFLGHRSYGIGAAALNYFNKTLDKLTIAEAAFLAVLPKAPSRYSPTRNKARAIGRRNWVLNRMAEEKFITQDEADKAKKEDITMHKRDLAQVVEGGFFAEEIRRNIIEKYGEEKLYQGGLTIHTTVDPDLQKLAQKCLQDGLEAYDRRHGWRGPFARTKQTTGSWHKDLKKFPQPEGMGNWKISIVTDSNSSKASIGFHSGKVGVIPRAQAKWTRRAGHMSSLLRPGDIIFVQHVENKPGVFALKQVPKASGGLIAIDPYTSRVLALQGGFSYGISQFNRATQALRQPGSAFKPFVFLAALERGMSPSSIVRDSPFSISLGWGRGMWRPRNYNHKYMGSITIRKAVEKSRNVPTVRITHEKLGMNKIIEMAKKFGISDKMPKHLSAVLGSSETTLIKMTAAYASLVNGGRKVNPILVDRIQDRHGHTIEFGAPRKCVGCVTGIWNNQERPTITDISSKATDPRSAYQMVNILTGVVKQGTAQVIKRIAGTEHPLGGKTGTTNDYKDAWFIGISPRLVVGTYIGFDNPKSLGRGEAGSRAAAPIVGNFFKEALKNQPPIPYNIPAGIRMVKVNKNSGRRTYASGNSVIMEAFKYDDYYDDGDDLGYDFDDSPASFTTSTQRRPRTYTSKITKTKSRSRKKRSSGGNGNSGLGGLY